MLIQINYVFIILFICRDSVGNVSQYAVISVIEFQGTLALTGQSDGHYICDIKESSSGKWFRTNDNNHPIPIESQDVSKSAYVVLYKRC